MADARISQANNAYSSALKAAENILQKVSNSGISSSAPTESTKGGFFDMVGNALESAVNTGYKSEYLATRSMSGKADIADVITAVSDAETALNTVVAVRDRVITAYQDIIKMPI